MKTDGHDLRSTVKSPWLASIPSKKSSSTPIACAVAIVLFSKVSLLLVHHQLRPRFGLYNRKQSLRNIPENQGVATIACVLTGGRMSSVLRRPERTAGSSSVGQSV